MGFFSGLGKALNPVNHLKELKDPGKHAKNQLARGLDPAGSLVREGRGMQAMPTKAHEVYNPSGFIKKMNEPAPAAPNTYQPGTKTQFQLSPRAQALYDRMTQRTAMPAQQAPAPQAPAPRVRQPLPPQVGIAPPQQLADGGEVMGKQRAKLDVDCHYENKAFDRKPNGKPC